MIYRHYRLRTVVWQVV